MHMLTWPLGAQIVLAVVNDIPLFRPLLPRPALPRLLPTALCPSPRGVVWPVPRALLLAAGLLDSLLNPPVAARLYALPRPPAILHTSIHMVATESRHQAELSRAARLHSAIPTLGADGVQPRHAWVRAQG